MKDSIKSVVKLVLRGVTWLFLATAFVAFWEGGSLIRAHSTKTDRVLAEMEGIGIAALFGGLGTVTKLAEEQLVE
jgi:hypothetical protein